MDGLLKVVNPGESLLEVFEDLLDVSPVLHKPNVPLRDGQVTRILFNLLLLPFNLQFQVLVLVFKLKRHKSISHESKYTYRRLLYVFEVDPHLDIVNVRVGVGLYRHSDVLRELRHEAIVELHRVEGVCGVPLLVDWVRLCDHLLRILHPLLTVSHEIQMAPSELSEVQELLEQTVMMISKAFADLFRASFDKGDGILLSHVFPISHLSPLRFLPLTLRYLDLLQYLDLIQGRLISKRILAECGAIAAGLLLSKDIVS